MSLVLLLLVLGLLVLAGGLFTALKWLLIIAVVLFVAGAFLGYRYRGRRT